MLPMRRALASCLVMSLLPCLAGLAAGPLSGQQIKRPAEPVLHAYALKYQRASEAVSLVHPLLSANGTVELQPAGNTLVIRDTPAALARILPVLRGFDHPQRRLQLELFIVRASRSQTSPRVMTSDLPEQLTHRLRQILPYEMYRMEAQALLGALEGESVTFDMGPDYQVSFRMGTLLGDGRVKLTDFRISRRSPKKSGLIHTHLNLWVDQTMSLGLAKSEESREALMVVLTMRSRVDPTRAVTTQ
jgi:hypothetical protein